MSLEIVRRVRGNVHGTIDVTALEDAVISHPIVQRLRRIKQLAFLHYVFPGATHTRFEHSLGVMQLAGIAWDKLHTNQRRFSDEVKNHSEFDSWEEQQACEHGRLAPTFDLISKVFKSDYNLQLIRLAGLLHDLGHPPFSHSGELFMPTWQDVYDNNRDMPDYLDAFFQARMEKLQAKGKDPSQEKVRHEIFSVLLADRVLRETARDFPDLSLSVDPRDLVSVIMPEIEPAPSSPVMHFGVHRLLNELVSGELDIDRMDYLLRDSGECGVVYGIFDFGRILDSLSVYFDQKHNGLHIAINFSGLAAFEDYLRARHSMYLQVYFHKTAVAAEAMMADLAERLGTWCFPAQVDDYWKLDEVSIGHELSEAGKQNLPSAKAKREFDQTLRDLLYDRKLWKRVYEVTGGDEVQQLFGSVCSAVANAGVPWRSISTGSSLTRFQPRGRDEKSSNYLRLIKKGERKFPEVVPIEDFASVVNLNEKTTIHRIYCGADRSASGYSGSRVRELIFDSIGG